MIIKALKLPPPQQKIFLHIMVVADITFFADINISNVSVLKYSGWGSALVAGDLLQCMAAGYSSWRLA